MQYQKHYDLLMSKALIRTAKVENLEKHHILPKSLGGSNEQNNLVYLTMREHFVAHKLLTKMFSHNSMELKKMIYAFWWMCKTRNNIKNRVSSYDYEYARKLFVEHAPSRNQEIKDKVKERREAGLYNFDYKKVATTLKHTLSMFSSDERLERMKKSAHGCDQIKRGISIKKGKASLYKMINIDDLECEFWSYDDVERITGYSYTHIRYRIKRHNGILKNGNRVVVIQRYAANDIKIKGLK